MEKTIVMRTDKVYKCELINIVELTSMEKLFHLKITDPQEAKIFSSCLIWMVNAALIRIPQHAVVG